MDHDRSFHSELYTSLGEDLPELPTIVAPAKPSVRPATLGETCFVLPENRIFIDKILPPTKVQFTANSEFPLSYFVALHRLVAEVGPTYPPYTANFCGARIPLKHTKLNIPRWRHHLIGYDEPELVQFFGIRIPYRVGNKSTTCSLFHPAQSWVCYPVLQSHGPVHLHCTREM